MAIALHLPVLKDNPVMAAETRPQKIAELLENTQAQSIQVGSSSLQRQLVELNRQKIAAKNRIQALDLYQPVVMRLTEILADKYANATLPLDGQVRAAANMVETLWLELAYGYKLAFVDLQNQLIKSNKTAAHCIKSAMQAINEYTLAHYQTYSTPPNHVWSDLHQLYFCAVQLGIAQDSETKATKTKNQTITPSIENTYKQALLLYLADTQRLTPNNIRHTAEILAAHLNKAHISGVVPLDSPAASFIIRLQSNEPPIAYHKQQAFPDPATDILLLTIDLVKALHSQLSRLQNNQLASESRENEIDLLTHLIKHWGIPPKRVFRRLAKNGDLDLVAGISAIHLSSNVTSVFNSETKSLLPSRWQILNISATGIALRRHPTAEKNIQIGSLIAIKTKAENHWSLGVVRWANCGARDKLDIGVQLIAPQVKSASARIDNRDVDEPILSVPPISSNKVGASIIVPRGNFAASRRVALNVDNQTNYAIMTKCLERSQQFEQIQYELIG